MLIAEREGMVMEHFLDTQETIPPGYGFEHFGLEHFIWLGAFAVLLAMNCVAYRRLDSRGREKWRKTVALLIVADEVFKFICLFIGGTFLPKYLPFHLCSINIVLVAIHAWKPSKLLDNFLYLACLPGAVMAMLFCTWAMLPAANFMYWHSFTIHILLVMYPLVQMVAGDIRPDVRQFPKSLLLLCGMAVPVWIFNILFDTNFMFLAYAEPGTPLVWFEEHWGNHLLGFPVLVPAVLLVMAIPARILEKRRMKTETM